MTPRAMDAIPVESFTFPLSPNGGLPLRVAVYEVVAGVVRNGTLPTGGLLPPEAEMAAAFRVSRTVMREALILLEEDGLIRTHRGVGRFVTDVVPEIGLESLRPIERMLEPAVGTVVLRRLGHGQEPATDFTERWLGLEPDGTSELWESLITRDGEPVAMVQEWISGPADGGDPGVAATVHGREGDGVSMLAALLDRFGARLGPAVCHVSCTSAGAERAQALGVEPAAPLLLLTQAVACDGRPCYAAKVLFRPEAGHLTVVQS